MEGADALKKALTIRANSDQIAVGGFAGEWCYEDPRKTSGQGREIAQCVCEDLTYAAPQE